MWITCSFVYFKCLLHLPWWEGWHLRPQSQWRSSSCQTQICWEAVMGNPEPPAGGKHSGITLAVDNTWNIGAMTWLWLSNTYLDSAIELKILDILDRTFKALQTREVIGKSRPDDGAFGIALRQPITVDDARHFRNAGQLKGNSQYNKLKGGGWGFIQWLLGREVPEAGNISDRASWSCMMMCRVGINASMQVLNRGKIVSKLDVFCCLAKKGSGKTKEVKQKKSRALFIVNMLGPGQWRLIMVLWATWEIFRRHPEEPNKWTESGLHPEWVQ